MKKTAILFDLDGTLIDSLLDICAILNRIRKEYGLPETDPELLRSFIGKGVEYLVQHGFPELSSNHYPSVIHKYRAYYLDTPQVAGSPFPKVRETLGELGRLGLRIAVVTNKPTTVAEKTLEAYLPGVKFEVVAGPERVTEKKPSPKHLLETLAKMNVRPEQACYVGDDPVDAQCASDAGVTFFGATYGIGKLEVPEAQRLGTFADLLEKLKPSL